MQISESKVYQKNENKLNLIQITFIELIYDLFRYKIIA